jgi:hypothetical protein
MKVHYLCHPPCDSTNFVYAAELPVDHYAPGMFCVESSNASGRLSESFEFFARIGQQVISPKLIRVNARTYSVEVKELNIKFFFKLINFDRASRYVGGALNRFSNFPLLRVQPANSLRLEQACEKYDFYFVGLGYDLFPEKKEG